MFEKMYKCNFAFKIDTTLRHLEIPIPNPDRLDRFSIRIMLRFLHETERDHETFTKLFTGKCISNAYHRLLKMCSA